MLEMCPPTCPYGCTQSVIHSVTISGAEYLTNACNPRVRARPARASVVLARFLTSWERRGTAEEPLPRVEFWYSLTPRTSAPSERSSWFAMSTLWLSRVVGPPERVQCHRRASCQRDGRDHSTLEKLVGSNAQPVDRFNTPADNNLGSIRQKCRLCRSAGWPALSPPSWWRLAARSTTSKSVFLEGAR